MDGPIARIWRGRVPRDRADAYVQLMVSHSIPEYRAVPGNRGAWALRRDEAEPGVTEVTMLSFWDSFDAIRGFAGDDVDRARYYDYDPDFLLDFPERVEHYALYEG